MVKPIKPFGYVYQYNLATTAFKFPDSIRQLSVIPLSGVTLIFV